MTPERWTRVKEVFEAAVERPAPARMTFVRVASEGDDEVMREVGSLLEAHEAAGLFLASPTLTAAPPEERPGRVPPRIGPYPVLRELGSGGMGTVYLAEQAGSGFRRPVAVKVIRGGHVGALFVKRFENERRILAALAHPNVASLIDGGTTDDGLPYLVMEYVSGVPLHEFCDSHQLSVARRVALFRKVCAAVQYAHQNLIVHRDLKPANILVTGSGEPKLLDFGLAKVVESLPEGDADRTATEMRIFTPAYASPEQVKGEAITTASDIYSLGVVLYVLLTGKKPYRVATGGSDELARAVVEQEPVRPSASVRDSPRRARALAGDLDTIVLKAMQKDPQRRYASAEQLSEDLRRYLEGQPVKARPASRAYRFGKFASRHRAGITVAALFVGVVAAAFVETARQRARAERRFEDVRQLAHELVFEIHDSIATLPGSTKVRELLVRRAAAYLDRLEPDARGDARLQREIAAAREKLGDVLGGANANLGDVPGALQNLRKALAIREAVVRSTDAVPDDRRALARCESALGSVLMAARDETAAEHFRRGLALLESTPGPADSSTLLSIAIAHFNLSEVLVAKGDFAGALGEKRKEVAIQESLLARSPGDPRRQRNVALAYKTLGALLERTNDRPAARTFYERAVALDESRCQAHPDDDEARMDLSFSFAALGTNQAVAGDLEGALVNFRRSLALREAVAAADPANVWARRSVGRVWTKIGAVLGHLKRFDECLQAHRSALAVFETLAKSNPTDPTCRADVERVQKDVAAASTSAEKGR